MLHVWVSLLPSELQRAFAGSLVRYASRTRTPEAMALLRALAGIAAEELAEPAARAAATLAAAGVPDPPWAAAVGRAEFVSAWLFTHPWGDQDVVFATFRHAGRPSHSFSVLIDHNLGGIVKDIALTEQPPEEIVEQWRAEPDFEVRRIGPEEVAGGIEASLDLTAPDMGAQVSEDMTEHLALLESRIGSLPHGWVFERPDLPSEAEQDALIQDFVGSPEGGGGWRTRRIPRGP